MQKAGAHRLPPALGPALIAPDTSPRGPKFSRGFRRGLDLRPGALSISCQRAPGQHYRMQRLRVQELSRALSGNCPSTTAGGISGHRWEGTWAWWCAFAIQALQALSRHSPNQPPQPLPLGREGLRRYLGPIAQLECAWDAARLIALSAAAAALLSTRDSVRSFLESQLRPQDLEGGGSKRRPPTDVSASLAINHSYFFIARLSSDHLRPSRCGPACVSS